MDRKFVMPGLVPDTTRDQLSSPLISATSTVPVTDSVT